MFTITQKASHSRSLFLSASCLPTPRTCDAPRSNPKKALQRGVRVRHPVDASMLPSKTRSFSCSSAPPPRLVVYSLSCRPPKQWSSPLMTAAKKSKKRAREEADKEGGEEAAAEKQAEANGSGSGSSGEKRPRGQSAAEGEGGEGAGGGDAVDAATKKALAKAAIGIVKKVRRVTAESGLERRRSFFAPLPFSAGMCFLSAGTCRLSVPPHALLEWASGLRWLGQSSQRYGGVSGFMFLVRSACVMYGSLCLYLYLCLSLFLFLPLLTVPCIRARVSLDAALPSVAPRSLELLRLPLSLSRSFSLSNACSPSLPLSTARWPTPAPRFVAGPEQTNSGEGTRQAGGRGGFGGQGRGHQLARRPAAQARPEAAVKERRAPPGDGGGQDGRLQQGGRRTLVSFLVARGVRPSIGDLPAHTWHERRCLRAARGALRVAARR